MGSVCPRFPHPASLETHVTTLAHRTTTVDDVTDERWSSESRERAAGMYAVTER